MNLDLIPLREGWKWHEWSDRSLGVSTRWLRYTPQTPDERVIYRCTDCGWETWNIQSISGHNRTHGAVPDEPRRQDTPSGLRNVTHSGARVAD
jgi:hypothetical protein